MDDRELALALAAWMEQHLTEEVLGPDLERISGYSENRTRQKFYAVAGDTPSGYLRKRRLTQAARAILEGQPLVEVAMRFGYSSQENFSTAFKAWFGLGPGELRTVSERHRLYLSRIKEPLTVMEIKTLHQLSLSSSMMSCIKGASDYFDLDWSVPQLFGYGTMGFLLNMHKDLCPSSPYVWKKAGFWLQLRNMGIRFAGDLSIQKQTPQEDILKAEARIKQWLDSGKLIMLDFLENQLVSGYDDQGLIFLRSWGPESPSEISKLTFGHWGECLDKEGWVSFCFLEKEDQRADRATLLQGALSTALRMRSAPEDFTDGPDYRGGDEAWDSWLGGLDRGLGNTHGHWWNTMVWSECRRMASEFFADLAPSLKTESQQTLARNLATLYARGAEALSTVARMDHCGTDEGRLLAPPLEVQKRGVQECRQVDAEAETLMRSLLAQS